VRGIVVRIPAEARGLVSSPAVSIRQSPVHCVSLLLSSTLKQQGCKAVTISSAEVTTRAAMSPLTHKHSWRAKGQN
jgi:hypothetical protein